MSWVDIFQEYKIQGRDVEWMEAQVNLLFKYNLITQTEYDEIITIINS